MPPSSQYQTSVRSTPCADAVATTRPKLRAAPKSTLQTSRQSFRFMLLLLNLTLHFLWEQILGLATGLQRAGCGAIQTAVVTTVVLDGRNAAQRTVDCWRARRSE